MQWPLARGGRAVGGCAAPWRSDDLHARAESARLSRWLCVRPFLESGLPLNRWNHGELAHAQSSVASSRISRNARSGAFSKEAAHRTHRVRAGSRPSRTLESNYCGEHVAPRPDRTAHRLRNGNRQRPSGTPPASTRKHTPGVDARLRQNLDDASRHLTLPTIPARA